MEENERKFIEAVNNDTSYDFIANNYMNFSKEQLKDIIIELMYAIHIESNDEKTILDSALDELTDRWSY